MTIDKRDLQRSIDRFDAPEPAFDRLVVRRDRRERRKRIEAVVVALTVVAATGGLIARSLVTTRPVTPTSAAPPACAAGTWETPSPAGVSGFVFQSVATSDTETYVVVGDGHGGQSMLRHDPNGWSPVSSPTEHHYSIAAPPVGAGSAPSPVWLLGQDSVWVLQTDAWHALPDLPLPAGQHARAVSVGSADDIWVVAGSDRDTTMLRFDGTSWSAWPLPHGDTGASVLALGARDAWVGGERPGDAGSLVPFTGHWDGASWTDVAAPRLEQAGVTTLVAWNGDVWAAAQTALNDGHPTTHLLHLEDGTWHDTRTLEGDAYRFHVLAGGPSGIWRFDWSTPDGPPTTVDHWTGRGWEQTTAVPAGWDLGGRQLWQVAALDVTDQGVEVVRMGEHGVVDFRYAC